MNSSLEYSIRDAPILLAVVDQTLNCTELSSAWRDLLGLGRQASVALPVGNLFDAVDQGRVLARIRASKMDGRAVRGLAATLTTAARPLPVRLWSWQIPTDDDAGPRTVIAAYDAVRTGQLVGETARMHSHHQQILDAAGDGVIAVDDLGRATYANTAAIRILGAQPEDIIGHPLHDVLRPATTQGVAYERDESPIRRAFKDGDAQHMDDELFFRVDGTAVPVHYSSTPIWSKERLVGAAVVFRDSSGTQRLKLELQGTEEEIVRLQEQLELEREFLRAQHQDAALETQELVAESRSFKRALDQLGAIASVNANVLLIGEASTGKATLSSYVLQRSTRAERPLVKVFCAGADAEAVEIEIFGRTRGADAAADNDRVGRFDLAKDATLLLEEVGELSIGIQRRLLQMLEELDSRLGSEEAEHSSIRIIATSNRPLEDDARDGRFLEALYDRLAVFTINIPALRERQEDVLPLATRFIINISQELGRAAPLLKPEQLQELQAQPWPGNIRELHNVIEHAIILSEADKLCLNLALPDLTHAEPQTPATPQAATVVPESFAGVRTDAELRDVERANTISALRQCEGRVSGPEGAAKLLGLKASTLTYRMKNFDIRRHEIVGRPHATLHAMH